MKIGTKTTTGNVLMLGFEIYDTSRDYMQYSLIFVAYYSTIDRWSSSIPLRAGFYNVL